MVSELPVALWYQTARYSPIILHTLEGLSTIIKQRITADSDHLSFLLEEIFGDKSTRSKSFEHKKQILRKYSSPFELHYLKYESRFYGNRVFSWNPITSCVSKHSYKSPRDISWCSISSN